jgi:two-component system sensor histidine kinase and response regulator WspE
MSQDDLSNFSMLDLFRTEVENQVAVLNEGLLTIEKDPTATKVLETLMRAAHSLKGAARIVQIDPAVKVAHALEDCFVAAQKGTILLTAEKMDVILEGIDFLTRSGTLSEQEVSGWIDQQTAKTESLVSRIAALAIEKQVPVEKPAPVIAEPPQIKEKEEARTVRIHAENLNRLLAYAAETSVAASSLQSFVDSLRTLKNQQKDLMSTIANLQETQKDPAQRTFADELLKQAAEIHQGLANRYSDLESYSVRAQIITKRLYREVLDSRMRPFRESVDGMPRMVRDVSRQLGKKVKFEILGRKTKVDRDVLEKLEAPLNHLLRNALDHGIETPEERIAAGKPEEGMLLLEASHKGGMLDIQVLDDGRGVDFQRLRKKLIDKKLITTEMAETLSEPELLEFLFLPGFSTTDQVTELSGRGVGLDIVYSMVREVGGQIRSSSQPNQGMSVHLQLPITLSLLRALIVEIAGEPYAFPLSRIDKTCNASPEQLRVSQNHFAVVNSNGDQFPAVTAQDVLQLPANRTAQAIPPAQGVAAATPPPSEGGSGEWVETGKPSPSLDKGEESRMVSPTLKGEESLQESTPVVLISDAISRYGVIVDRFVMQKDLVVRPLDPRLGKVKNIHAASILEDGSPVLILDVQDMLRSIDQMLSWTQNSEISDQSGKKKILLVEDSITVRELERKLLTGQGYQVEVAVDGMDGWNVLKTGAYDLVITDLDMPRMNGIEFIKRIRADFKLRNIPVLMVSYKERKEDQEAGLQAGANRFLSKSSFHDMSFLQVVQELIQGIS